jgi:hypothetical protein
MSVTLIDSSKDGFTLQISFKYSKSMLEGEQKILEKINQAGTMATGKLLEQFDTDGSPIKVGNQTFTTKGPQGKDYQTPYGTVRVMRHIYQSHSGGKTYCPLEHDARIIITSTPKFAQMISSKYSQMGVRAVNGDLENNHGRIVQMKIVQDVTEAVGAIALAKEDKWDYILPTFDRAIEGISIGLDGTCMLMKDEGWREAMTGTISFYDKFGERLHTTYVAAPPEYGKGEFLNKFEREINRVKEQYPKVYRLGLADGARDNWPFLNKHTDHQLIDFYHASEYIGKVGKIIRGTEEEKALWIENQCHKLKHNMGAASRFANEIIELKKTVKKKEEKETLGKVLSYFKNNNDENRMQYYKFADSVMPIGSGATEAACKVIVKQRMCKSGMRWKNAGAQVILITRCLHETEGRWEQFWSKIDQYGFNVAA